MGEESVKQNFLILAAVSLSLFCIKVYSADFAYFESFHMLADKSSIVIEIKHRGDQFALQVAFGPGVLAKATGIVFKEKSADVATISKAMLKLTALLNDPKVVLIRAEQELSKDIGLTYDREVDHKELE